MRFLLFLWIAVVLGGLFCLVAAAFSTTLRRYMEEVSAGEVLIIFTALSLAALMLIAW